MAERSIISAIMPGGASELGLSPEGAFFLGKRWETHKENRLLINQGFETGQLANHSHHRLQAGEV